MLGLPEANGFDSASIKPFRGRGRGRGAFRGASRGGPPRGSMKLDNRPKKLLVKGAPEGGLLSIRSFYDVCAVDPYDTIRLIRSLGNRTGRRRGRIGRS